MFFEDKFFRSWQAGGMHTGIDDFNGDNFDHADLGFLGGGYISCAVNGGQPIGARQMPRGTPELGRGVEAGDGEMVWAFGALCDARLRQCEPQQFSRS